MSTTEEIKRKRNVLCDNLQKINNHTFFIHNIHIDSLYELYVNHKEPVVCEFSVNDDMYFFYIGLYYHKIQVNELKMLKYYHMSIEMKNVYSMCNLGEYYQEKKDEFAMLRYLKMAMATNMQYPKAMYLLGVHYREKKDVSNMLAYLNMASKLKHSDAMYLLGVHYQEKKDVSNMLVHWRKASEQKHSEAMYLLGVHYQEKKDVSNMLVYWRKASEQKHSEAMYHLGKYYQEKKDIPNMIMYYKEASELKDSYAMVELGLFYDEQNDIPNMLKYYEMAVALGNSVAMTNLGFYYHKKKDIPNMVKYWEMAIEHGNIIVLNNYLSEIVKDNSTIPYDKSKIEMAIRNADLKEKTNDNMNVNVLQKCIKYAIHIQDETLFFHLYETYKTSSLTHSQMGIGMTTKPFETFHLFYMGRCPFVKIETCSVCMEEDKKIIPFDCFWHGYCVMCTFKIKECAICKIPKHPYFAKMFEA